MLFFRLLVHLLPRGIAWQVTVDKMLRRFLQGLSQAPADLRDFADAAYLDMFPATTRELAAWEKQFGLLPPNLSGVDTTIASGIIAVTFSGAMPFAAGQTILIGAGAGQHAYTIGSATSVGGSQANLEVSSFAAAPSWAHAAGSIAVSVPALSSSVYSTPGTLLYTGITTFTIPGSGPTPEEIDAARRAQLVAAWSAQGGQSRRYLEDVVRAAGFDVHIYEWWIPGTMPRTVRDPRSYTDTPRVGTVRCGDTYSRCTSRDTPPLDPLPAGVHLYDLYPQCNRWLANIPGYLVNEDLTPSAPPFISANPDTWRYFIYVMGATFGTQATVPAARRAEFERLLLKLRPSQQWIVTYVNYV